MDHAIVDDELPGIFEIREIPKLIVLGVSGGADSIAMMHLFARYLRTIGARGRWAQSQVLVATVDHGLRRESRDEAVFVARQAERLGFEHVVLPWVGEKPSSGLQQAARDERYRLLWKLCEERGGRAAIMVAHHCGDQAETVIMRLARGSGLIGLKGMRREAYNAFAGKCMIWRPFLGLSKSRLLETLVRDKVSWIEDPSNENMDYERVRVRGANKERAVLGLSDEAVFRSARRLMRADMALEEVSARAIETHVCKHFEGAYCEVSARFVCEEPEEIVLRVISYVLQLVSSSASPPNLSKLENFVVCLVASVRSDGGPIVRTLGGCVAVWDGSGFRAGAGDGSGCPGGLISFFYEPGRAELTEFSVQPGDRQIWGERFRISLSDEALTPLTVRALGSQTLRDLSSEGGLGAPIPKRAALSLPSFWDNDRLVHVPHLDYSMTGWGEPLPDVAFVAHKSSV